MKNKENTKIYPRSLKIEIRNDAQEALKIDY